MDGNCSPCEYESSLIIYDFAILLKYLGRGGGTLLYIITGNFDRKYFRRSVGREHFMEKTFAEC